MNLEPDSEFASLYAEPNKFLVLVVSTLEEMPMLSSYLRLRFCNKTSWSLVIFELGDATPMKATAWSRSYEEPLLSLS